VIGARAIGRSLATDTIGRSVPIAPLFKAYDQVILDLDGCVWVGDDAVPGSPAAVEALRDAGKRVAFATNDPRHPTEDIVAKLWRLGIRASLADVVTVGGAMQHYLAEQSAARSAVVIGTPALREHVADAGLKLLGGTDRATTAEVVVVGGTDDLTFDDLKEASLALRAGADFLATGRDPTYPMPDGLWPGTGAILAAIETATDREATIIGKPEPQLFITAIDRLGEGRTLAVGDRLDSDIAGAAAAGLDAALVLSGGTSAAEAEASTAKPAPVAVAANLDALVNGP
jgi:HAD superfamily hydrolase (TIGR01450 family)